MRHHILHALVDALLILLLLPSCADDSSMPDDGLTMLSCTILTRSAGDADIETLPNELITDWWIVMADASGTVRHIARREQGNTTPIERDECSVALPASLYTVYAFANISPDELFEHTGLRFTVGEKPQGDVTAALWDEMPNGFDNDAPLPMSGCMKIALRGGSTQCEIEVVRMLAKIRISLSNQSDSGISLDGITFGILNRGAIPLFPDYDALGDRPAILQQPDVTTETFSPTLSPLSVAPGDDSSCRFYVRESSALLTHPAGRFFMTLSMHRADGVKTEEYYVITDNLQWIQRNDFIDIPVVISDITTDWDVLFYPPIGGYPAVTQTTEGDSRFITFGSPGKFRIRPKVTSGGVALPPSAYSFEITATEGDEGIFLSLPAKDPVTGEITGELSGATGSAVLHCTLTIEEGGITTSRSRRLYIIRNA